MNGCGSRPIFPIAASRARLLIQMFPPLTGFLNSNQFKSSTTRFEDEEEMIQYSKKGRCPEVDLELNFGVLL